MTPEQINRLMAEQVMGFSIIGRSTRWWLRTENWDELTNFSSIPDNPVYFDPYHRIEHAMMALEKFKTWEFGKNEDPVPYYCVIDFDKSIGVADTPSAAICEAIAKALE